MPSRFFSKQNIILREGLRGRARDDSFAGTDLVLIFISQGDNNRKVIAILLRLQPT